MQPNLFTVIVRHPDCVPAIVTNLDLNGITAVALAANPVKSVEAFPMQMRDLDPQTTARQIEDAARIGVLAHYRPGGFDVEYVGPGAAPKWAQEVIRSLDYTQRQGRIQRAAEKEAQRVAAIAAQAPKDTGRKADAARERARDLNLPHDECKELFELEQRARLVA
mgnify:CR=1 FL=1